MFPTFEDPAATFALRNRLCSLDEGDGGDDAGDAGGGGTAVAGDQADGGEAGDGDDSGGSSAGTSNKVEISKEDRERFKGVPEEFLPAAVAPYRELKKLYDPMAERLNKLEAKNQTLDDRIAAVGKRSEPSETETQLNRRVDALMDKLSRIPSTDTERTRKIYRELVQLQGEIAEEKFYRLTGKEKAVQEAKTSAEKDAVAELKKNGLAEDNLEDFYRELDHIELRDPDWFRRTPDAQQIPELVKRVVDRVNKIREAAKATKAANDKNKQASRGVLDEGSRHIAASGAGEEEEDTEPDSIIDQLRNLRKDRVREGGRLFQQITARPGR